MSGFPIAIYSEGNEAYVVIACGVYIQRMVWVGWVDLGLFLCCGGTWFPGVAAF